LADTIAGKQAGQAANNLMSLTDTILVSGAAINPAFLAQYGIKKTLGSETAKSLLIKALNGKNIKQIDTPDLEAIRKAEAGRFLQKEIAPIQKLALPSGEGVVPSAQSVNVKPIKLRAEPLKAKSGTAGDAKVVPKAAIVPESLDIRFEKLKQQYKTDPKNRIFEDALRDSAKPKTVDASLFSKETAKNKIIANQKLNADALKNWTTKIKNGERPLILVDKVRNSSDMVKVIDGHHRLAAYKKLGIKDIPIVDNTDNVLSNIINKSN
jgi:hypothetical protein